MPPDVNIDFLHLQHISYCKCVFEFLNSPELELVHISGLKTSLYKTLSINAVYVYVL